jgi:hypothetical protein
MNTKRLNAFLLTAVFISILAVSVSPIPVNAATTFSGVINSDTIWTLANSPYSLTGNVLVNQSATLTVEPGVTVNTNDYYIRVDGTLNAQGTNDNKITLTHGGADYPDFDGDSAVMFTGKSTTWNETSQTGCIISNAVVTNSKPGDSFAISITSAGPKICNSTIISTGNNRAIYISNDYGNSAALIVNNYISSNMEGITINIQNSNVNTTQIINNTISNCQVGIEVYGGNPLIAGNLIINNTGSVLGGNGGIRLDYINAVPTIVNNTITGNSVGLNVLDAATATLTNNNIINNSLYNVYLYPGLTGMSTERLDATNNYWGTVDAQAINQSLYDYKYDFNLGEIYFTPYLSTPIPAAPTYVNATSGVGGSITSSGVTKIEYGGNKTYTFSPNSGYNISDVLVNGSSVGAVATYTIQNMQGPTTITAVFAVDPTPTPTPTATPTVAPTNQPTTTPSPTANPTSHPTSTPPATPATTPTPTPTYPATATPSENSPIILTPFLLIAIAAVIIAVVVIAVLLLIRKRR